jgi:hypothetical protein
MDWQNLIGKLAPTVATALLGPAGGVAISAIASILGVENGDTKSIEEALNKGQLTPDQITKLKELELKYQNEEKERGFKYEELTFKDRDSARARDIEYVKVGKTNTRADLLAYGALIAFIVSGWALFKYDMPPGNRELVVYLLGALTVIVKDLYSFEFGSSRSSAAKTEELAKQTGEMASLASKLATKSE